MDDLTGEQRSLETASAEALRRNARKMRVALLVAALVAVLVWKTQRPTLLPGLILLMVGQFVFAGYLFARRRQLRDPVPPAAYYARERAALRKEAWLENGPRILGFVILAGGFWQFTHSIVVTAALGVVYPALLAVALASALRISTRPPYRQRESL